MHDFDYDVLEKKRTARSARNKVNGSRTKYVSLPSDHLSSAERKKLNGECIVYSLDKVVSWVEFKRLPDDIKRKYLENIRDRFGVSSGYVAEMFGITAPTFSKYLKANGFARFFVWQTSQERVEAFRAWWQGTAEEKPVVEEKPAKREPKKPEPMYFAHVLKSGEFSLEGTGLEISQTLFGIFRDKRIRMQIVFEEAPVVVEEPEGVEETESVLSEDRSPA